jgi:hypothetical protein
MKKKTRVKPIPEPKFDLSKIGPPEEFKTNPRFAKQKDIKQLIQLIEQNSSESKIDNYLAVHPELLAFIISHYSTGHHHTWVIPKKIIKTRFGVLEKGLIPDYIVGGQSTSGREWFVIELKGANCKWFVEQRDLIYFTNTINKGIHQLIEYLDHCDTYQSKFRDEFMLDGFKKPKAILMAGRRLEFNTNRKKSIKKTWESLLGNRLEIVTYDRLADELKKRLNDFANNRKSKDEFWPFER